MATGTTDASHGDFGVELGEEEAVLRVKPSSNPNAVASALAHAVYDHKRVTLRAIGAGAVNQAVKACAIARGYVATRGIDITVRPGFDTVRQPEGSDKPELSAVTLLIIVS